MDAKVVISCSVRQLRDDLDGLDNQDAMVLVEVDGHARQVRGIRRATVLYSDGIAVEVIIIVGNDLPHQANN